MCMYLEQIYIIHNIFLLSICSYVTTKLYAWYTRLVLYSSVFTVQNDHSYHGKSHCKIVPEQKYVLYSSQTYLVACSTLLDVVQVQSKQNIALVC